MELKETKPKAQEKARKHYVQCAVIPQLGQPTNGIMRRIVIVPPPANPE